MIIRVKSHRAYDKVERILGYAPKGLYSFYFEGNFYEVPDTSTEVLEIKGVTKARVDESKLRECISWK